MPMFDRPPSPILNAAAAALIAGCVTAAPAFAKNDKPEPTLSLPAPTAEVERINWALYAEPSTLDPIRPNDLPPMEVLANVCESLMRVTPGFSLEPALAVSMEQPDPLTLVYKLRPGVVFHGGAELTADDVVYSLNRARNKELGSVFVSTYASVADITATGADEVTIKLKSPDNTLAEVLATNAARIVRGESTEAQGTAFGGPGSKIDCTGPYRFSEWRAGQGITLERFDGYWDKSLPLKVKSVDFSFVRDPAVRVNAMLSGQVDGTWAVPASGFARLAQSGAGTMAFGLTSGSYVAMVTNLGGALADARVRKALGMSIDTDGIISTAVAGAASPLAAPASPGTWGFARDQFEQAYAAIAAMPHGLEEAKRLIAEAGIPTQPIRIAITNAQPEMQIIGAEIQRAAQSIGMNAELVSLPADRYNSLYSDAKARDGIDLMFTLWQPRFPNPALIYRYLASDNFFNLAGWKNADFDAALAAARATNDPAARAAALIKAQQLAVDDPTWLPIYSPFNAVFLRAGLTGVPTAAVQLTFPWAAMIGGE